MQINIVVTRVVRSSTVVHLSNIHFNIILPLLQWRSNKYYIFCMCVCSLSYPAYKAHVPYYIVLYCHLWPVWLLIFPNYLINGTILGKRDIAQKMRVLIFSTFVWDITHFKKNQRGTIINVRRSSCKVPVILVRC